MCVCVCVCVCVYLWFFNLKANVCSHLMRQRV